MLTILDIIQNEAIEKWGEYKSERVVDKHNPMMVLPWEKDIQPDYLIYCSKYILEGIYQAVLSQGFKLISYVSEEHVSFSTKQSDYIRYQFPKMGVVHMVVTLQQGYLIQKINSEDEYKMHLIEKQ